MESCRGLTKAELADHRKEALDAVAIVFARTNRYLLAYVREREGASISRVHKLLYRDALRAPSQTKFYTDVKKAGGITAFLTYYFYNHIKSCLESLDLPPQEIERVVQDTTEQRRYSLPIEHAKRFAPSKTELQSVAPLRAKPRRFKFQPKNFPDALLARGIFEFFTALYHQNEDRYKKHPDQLFDLTLVEYADYLQSPFWFVIRNVVLYRDSFRCRLCDAQATCVHHLYYNADVLYGKDLTALVSICESCHDKIEFDEAGMKVTSTEEKRRRYERLIGETRGSVMSSRRWIGE
jgi:hypothetical protein